MEHPKTLSVLLIEDNPGDARLIAEALTETAANSFRLFCADRLSEGIVCLAERNIDLVLLDLSLPDSQNLETLSKLRVQELNVPVVVLTGLADEAMAVQAVQVGAQDYLVKGQFDGKLLVRSMRYAIERHRLRETIRELSLTDELTGLRNRRGLLVLAEQHLKMGRGRGKQAMLLFADLDDLKSINDRFGHAEGDQVLVETARILRETCRESDIVARVGGDEFVVLTLDGSSKGIDPLVKRFRKALREHSARTEQRYRLSCSIGVVCFDPSEPVTVEELMHQADQVLYLDKKKKSTA